MDTYKLINSKAIQEHCRKIKYQFNILELAVLIYRNKRMSIEKKISAYKELITDYPDMKMIKKYRPQNYDTVKDMIQGEIERIENLVNILRTDEQDVIYTYNYYCKNIHDNGIIEGKYEYRDVYKTLKEVEEFIEKDIKEDEEKEILSFAIRKRTISSNKNKYEIRAEYLLDKDRHLKLVNIYDIESGYLDDIEELAADYSQQEEQDDLELWNSKLEFYIDYQNLLVANDFRLLLLESGQGQQFEGNSDYVNISLLLQSFAQTISTASNQLLDDATMAYRNINNMLASERQLMQEALEDFNLYEFIENYGGSVDAYEKEERYAKAYYNELSKYFSAENNFISQYISYIQSNIYS